MTSTHRSIIYYLFTLVFFIASPLILLYASGYRIDPENGVLQQSGMILLEVVPEDARVMVNGTPVSHRDRSRGAIRLPGLAQGSYAIHIEKEGYFPWSTTLAVATGSVAAPPTIRLIRSTQAFLALPSPVEGSRPSPDQERFAVIIKQIPTKILILFSTNGGNPTVTVPLPNASGALDGLLWSPDSQKIAIIEKRGASTTASVYDLNRKILSRAFVTQPILRWDSRSETLITSDGKTFQRILPFTGQTNTVLLARTVVDLVSINDHFYALSPTASKTLDLLELKPTNTRSPLAQTITLEHSPLPPGSRLVSAPGFPLMIRTATLLLVIESLSDDRWAIVQEIPAAASQRITPREILTLDSNTVYRYRPGDDLIGVHSTLPERPAQILPVPQNPWILVNHERSLALYQVPSHKQLIGAPQQNVLLLEQGVTTIGDVTTDPSGRFLLFSGSKNGQSGVFIRLLTDASSAGPFER